MSDRKGPWKNTFWRGETLWAAITVRGVEIRFSLRLRKPLAPGARALARGRIDARRTAEVAALYFGEEKIAWEDAIEAWTPWIAKQVSAGTATRYASSLEQVDGFFAGALAGAIDKRLVGDMVAARQKAGLTNATIRRDLTAVSSVLGLAEARGWRDGNPALFWLDQLSETRDPIVLPDPAHIERVLARLPGLLSALARAAWGTGARQNELVSARRTQFADNARQLTLIGKGRKLRVIDLEGETYETLRRLPAALGGAFLFWHGNGAPFRNVSSRFAGYVGAEHRAAIRKAREIGPAAEPDFRPFRFHDLRHRHAVDWLKGGGSIYDLQHRLGHASIKTTEIYLQYLTPEEARRVKYGTKGRTSAVTMAQDIEGKG